MSLTVLSVAYPLAPVSGDAVGGAEQVLAALDRALVASGHRSLVLACEGSRVAGTLLPVAAEAGELDEAAKQRAWVRHRQAIAEALQVYPVDLVHLHGIDFAAYLPDRAPTLVTLHLPLDWYAAEDLTPGRLNLWMHAVSESQQRTAPVGAGLLPPIPNGVDAELLDRRLTRRGFALVLGRVCPEKGIHLALDAAQRAGLPLVIGGQVYPYRSHQDYFDVEIAPRLGAGRRFAGALPFARKRRFLNAARCLVVPSLAAETSSLVAMEALACGTPVVAFPNGALPDLIEHGVTGFLVNSIEEMADAMQRVGELDPQACRETARQRFSLERMTERYFALYAALAGRSGSA